MQGGFSVDASWPIQYPRRRKSGPGHFRFQVAREMSLDWLKHAFSVEPDGPIGPTEAQRPVVERLCRQVVARGMTTPAILFLETVRPLNYVSSQVLQFFSPVLTVLADPAACRALPEFLKHPGS